MIYTDLIQRDRTRLLAELQERIPYGTRYAFMEFPNYGNVGDTAIWLGALELLKEATGQFPSYLATNREYHRKALEDALPEGPIVLQGGGNFGDIHGWAQQFRERVIAENTGRRIIQMPQSIKYLDLSAAGRTAKILSRHPDFHMLVRDNNSLEFAKQHLGVSAKLAPDCAFGLGPLTRRTRIQHDVVSLLRHDEEMVQHDLSEHRRLNGPDPVDWITDPEGFEARSFRYGKVKSLFEGKFNWPARKLAIYRHQASSRLERGLRILSTGKYVLTDRLHAHILTTLLGIPHVCLDNNYGKIHSYIDAFTHDFDGVFKASTMKEAVDIVQSLSSDTPYEVVEGSKS
ncbi:MULTISPECIES: polysaccharide pyruvyl transferase family protein [Rhizobium]|uniref:Pyruvyl transferase EpsO n=1 Tax=Rhizobium lentis TaxID=1138194 RepID=A0A7W8XDE3_9HYPH|nr:MULTISPECIES: polysaccharide pyruvyl transferase family protein [Rhizobium]MBB4571988.1 pyruvyl transferase EpsO [Rhizobium lentis]MBB5548820.1 pyruvyl transferase EpsO [Rhizobium lentis]MBB5559352.1 pyruvyl transferase EpsO [Rhizobium lentis]MBB5565125.1 pyruvyl transferase EpsO [Rhizobium lentis]MEB3047739.1 polysaccharide pyruvyl transferase family protein [Rhizobium sp. MJ21]